jgi:hypothetical protein
MPQNGHPLLSIATIARVSHSVREIVRRHSGSEAAAHPGGEAIFSTQAKNRDRQEQSKDYHAHAGRLTPVSSNGKQRDC